MLSRVVVAAVLSLLAGGSCWGQVPGLGLCPRAVLMSNFSAQLYFTGRWYEQRRFFAAFEAGHKCVTASYSLAANGSVSVTNFGYLTMLQKRTYAYGTAYCEVAQPAYCHVRFSANSPYGDYKVLATDYRSYSLVHTCSNVLGFFNIQFAWLLTRQKTVSNQLITNAYGIFQRNGVDTSRFMTTLQDCSDN